ELERRKCAATERPRVAAAPAPHSRHVPAAVRREVWRRDAARCAYVSVAGRRCEATAFLEFHHVVPYGAGGPATTGTIQLRCGAHNRYEAEVYYEGSRQRTPGDARRLARSVAPS